MHLLFQLPAKTYFFLRLSALSPSSTVRLVLQYKHIYTLSLSSLLTLTVTVCSSPSLIRVRLNALAISAAPSAHREPFREGREGDKRRQVRGDAKKTREGRGHLVAGC